MKYFITLILLAVSFTFQLQAQTKKVKVEKKLPYEFTDVYRNYTSDTKDQCQTGTCWSFATTSFIESELKRMGFGDVDISEMYNVRMTYPKKAEKYLRYQGKYNFSAGSLAHDVIKSMDEHGIVTEDSYPGRSSVDEDYNHGELDKVLKGMMDAVIENGHMTEHWDEALDAVLDVYLGEAPKSFDVAGKSYSPIDYKNHVGFDKDNYVNVTSFTHHPFYEEFILEVPDNFSQGKFQNVKLEELTAITKNALKEGHTIAWDADVSEKGFSFKNGMAILPEDESLRRGELFKEKVPERKVTQSSRQDDFDNFNTTDDHLMHIIGMATDQDGAEYFIIKNSWGDDNPFGGIQYVSIPYFESKTISLLLSKEALTNDMKKKING